jgi:uncharacterized membrane protein
MNGVEWIGMTLMFLTSIVALLVVIYLAANLLNDSRRDRPVEGQPDHAIEILRERSARGELSEEAYRQARETIG